MMGGEWFHDLFGDPETASMTQFEDSAIRAVRTQLNTKVEPSKVKVTLQKVRIWILFAIFFSTHKVKFCKNSYVYTIATYKHLLNVLN